METYIAGKQIVCETQLVIDTGNYSLNIYIQRGSEVKDASAVYTVEQPQLTAIEPGFGPTSGGIEILVKGSSFDIGNTEKSRVELSGANCNIKKVVIIMMYLRMLL